MTGSTASHALRADAILAAAGAASGVPAQADDPSTSGLPGRIDRVASAYAAACTTPATQAVAFDALVRLAGERLRFGRDLREHPDIGEEVVQAPFVILGFARAGTTFLQSLLDTDPANHAPEWWEVMHPSPPGPVAADDPRFAQGDREVQAYGDTCPGVRIAHPYFVEGHRTLMECETLATLDFRNTYPFAFFEIPTLVGVIDPDDAATYRFHHRFLQHLQWHRPPRRWVLKGTTHQAHLEELFATYPDAMAIWPHRDPATLVPSLMELTCRLLEGLTGQPIDRRAVGRQRLAENRLAADAALASPLIDDPRILHVQYRDLTRDHVGTIRRIYEHFGVAPGDDLEERIGAWTADPDHRTDLYGRFGYSLDDFGITADEVDELFADYVERFQIER